MDQRVYLNEDDAEIEFDLDEALRFFQENLTNVIRTPLNSWERKMFYFGHACARALKEHEPKDKLP